ncbi:MAG TPA: helix-turn-helix transcriptional regulator [bacterium]|nr:helix-turn-helix transcriptional regulator [bacterium]
MSGLELGLACALEPTGALFVPAGPAGNQTLRLHDCCLFVFVAHGELEAVSGRSEKRLPAGHAALFQCDAGRAVVFHHDAGAEFYALKFKVSPHLPRARHLAMPARGKVDYPERLTDLLRRYVMEQRRRRPSLWALYNLLVLVLCEYAAAPGGSLEAKPSCSGLEAIASMVDAYVAAHYREPICANDIARELRYSPGYLERAYRRERGISVRSAIHLRRIREARAQLLLQREVHVSEIAAQCGYGDAAYFRRVFKRTTHMTPLHFRSINSGPADGRRAREFTSVG